eukprot:TRINITY_DN187_c0_g1_i1.p1 TRINITY_DN187_c0_g1~~TRINITY_DN187_c0_g1_i1.p1  ORF type:complete len:117 (+),score=14.65 TRINITY_DN187_c0_g1_i1:67-417(+)
MWKPLLRVLPLGARPLSTIGVGRTESILPPFMTAFKQSSGSVAPSVMCSWTPIPLTPQPVEIPMEDSVMAQIGDAPVEQPAIECHALLKKRRKKMNKHKYEKMRKKMRFERRKLGQ